MVKIDIFTSPHYPVNRKIIRKAVDETLNKVGIRSFTQVSVSVVGDRKVRELNRKFRGQDKTTNVLSFPLHEGDTDFDKVGLSGKTTPLGDVVISYPVARSEAAEQSVLVDHMLGRLTVHGMLHLVGFDHEDEFEARQMEKLEDEIFAKAGL
jgi:probable rRNA maturation factor